MSWRPLGAHLVANGILTPEELERALAEQERTGRRLGEVIVGLGLAPGTAITRALAEQAGIELRTEAGFGTGLWAAIERRHAEQLGTATGAGPDTEQPAALGATAVDPVAWRPLGELLVEAGVLTDETLELVLHEQERSGRRVGEIVVGLRLATPEAVARALSEQWGIGFEDGSAPASLSAELARSHASGPSADAAPEREEIGAALERRLAELSPDLERRGERLNVLAGGFGEPEQGASSAGDERVLGAQPEPATPLEAESHLVFVPSAGGYELRELDGTAPELGSALELSGADGPFVVSKVGRSPLPGDRRRCAYLQQRP